MSRFLFFSCYLFALLFSLGLNAQESPFLLSNIVVKSTVPDASSPFSSTLLSDSLLASQITSKDLPFIIAQTPSAVAYSDAGHGVGYTGLRIRGSDLTRINVTLNGMPYNDAESHAVYFVDIADIVSSAKNITIQRGVGVSAQGTSSFGGAIAISTLPKDTAAFLLISGNYGSYNTLRQTIQLGSGKIGSWLIEGRLSRLKSDGYVDRSSSNLYGTSFSVMFKPNARFESILSHTWGKEKTYQAWGGVHSQDLKENRKVNYLGLRTNQYPYPNQTDNYEQAHYQWITNIVFSPKVSLHAVSYLSRGFGFYEEYIEGTTLDNYAVQGDKRTQDITRQLHLDNWFVGQQFLLKINPNLKNELFAHLSANYYIGRHFGNLVSAELNPTAKNVRYYDFPAYKASIQGFAKWRWSPSTFWNIFLDVQLQHIKYQIKGFRSSPMIHHNLAFFFVNPKLGVRYHQKNHAIQASFGVGNREPVRADFENSLAKLVKPESLFDLELAYTWKKSNVSLSANLYGMFYQNQLINTGKINDVGSYTRENVPTSSRIGVEISYHWNIFSMVSLVGHVSAASHQISHYTKYLPDATNVEQALNYNNTSIAFSPTWMSFNQLSFSPNWRWSFEITNTFVGQQFLDNTSSKERMLDAYNVWNTSVSFTIMKTSSFSLKIKFFVFNLGGTLYEPNGYLYGDRINSSGTRESDLYFFPAAERNYTLRAEFAVY